MTEIELGTNKTEILVRAWNEMIVSKTPCGTCRKIDKYKYLAIIIMNNEPSSKLNFRNKKKFTCIT